LDVAPSALKRAAARSGKSMSPRFAHLPESAGYKRVTFVHITRPPWRAWRQNACPFLSSIRSFGSLLKRIQCLAICLRPVAKLGNGLRPVDGSAGASCSRGQVRHRAKLGRGLAKEDEGIVLLRHPEGTKRLDIKRITHVWQTDQTSRSPDLHTTRNQQKARGQDQHHKRELTSSPHQPSAQPRMPHRSGSPRWLNRFVASVHILERPGTVLSFTRPLPRL
jgi:hypothetical protein